MLKKNVFRPNYIHLTLCWKPLTVFKVIKTYLKVVSNFITVRYGRPCKPAASALATFLTDQVGFLCGKRDKFWLRKDGFYYLSWLFLFVMLFCGSFRLENLTMKKQEKAAFFCPISKSMRNQWGRNSFRFSGVIIKNVKKPL